MTRSATSASRRPVACCASCAALAEAPTTSGQSGVEPSIVTKIEPMASPPSSTPPMSSSHAVVWAARE